MTKSISPEHKLQFEAIRKQLGVIGYKEANFLKIELLFYDALEASRAYGNDPQENKLLAAFKHLQANQYQDTKALFRKSSQREVVIRRFITHFRTVLADAVKNKFYAPQLSAS